MKPMLAATLTELENARLPAYVSPKMDGIRCIIFGGMAVSRALKPIPNKFIQQQLKGLPDGLDGELMVRGDFNAIQSAVMSEEGEPEFFYVLFDIATKASNYEERYNTLCKILEDTKNPYLKIVSTRFVEDIEELKRIEEAYVAKRYEGIMLRVPESPYKHGRSTLKESYLVKYKRFKDAEAYIIGFEEQMHNDNEAEVDALGHTIRSTKAEGMVQANTLGSLIVVDKDRTMEFNIGSGFTNEQRQEIWNNKDKYKGIAVTYQYQDMTSKGVPRFPTFKGFRHDI